MSIRFRTSFLLNEDRSGKIVKPQTCCVIYEANIGFSLHDLAMKYQTD